MITSWVGADSLGPPKTDYSAIQAAGRARSPQAQQAEHGKVYAGGGGGGTSISMGGLGALPAMPKLQALRAQVRQVRGSLQRRKS